MHPFPSFLPAITKLPGRQRVRHGRANTPVNGCGAGVAARDPGKDEYSGSMRDTPGDEGRRLCADGGGAGRAGPGTPWRELDSELPRGSDVLRCDGRDSSKVLSVKYLDRFITVNELREGEAWMAQIFALACLSRASKMEEAYVPLSLGPAGKDHKRNGAFGAKHLKVRLPLAHL